MPTPVAASAAPTPSIPPGGAVPDPGKTLKNWSSLIGIVTAIVGNVLIALALNLQRYAHTRIHRARLPASTPPRPALKSTSTPDRPRPYGSIGPDLTPSAPRPSELDEAPASDDELDPLVPSEADADTNHCHPRTSDGPASTSTSTYLKSPYWWLGQTFITLGEMGNFLAYGFAPASIVSPLGVVALISNCIIAPVMFHEKFRARDFWGVLIAVAGVATVVLSANQQETKLEPSDVWRAITTTEFEIYLAVTTLLILLLMWASENYGGSTILIDLGLVGLFGKLFFFFWPFPRLPSPNCVCPPPRLQPQPPLLPLLTPPSPSTGGYTALATKGVSSMLSSTLWRAFTTPVTYVLILILLITAVMQIRYVNKALQRFDSTQVIPIQFVLFTLCVIVGSAVLYRDFEKTTPRQAATFVGGCLLTFFGVFLITSGRKQKESDQEEDLLAGTDGAEETISLAQHESNLPCTPRALPSSPESRSRGSSWMSRVSLAETVKAGYFAAETPTPSTRISALATTPTAPALLRAESSPLVGHLCRGSPDAPPSPLAPLSQSGPQAASTPGRYTPAASPADRPPTPRTTSSLSRPGSRLRSKTFISPSPLSSTVTTVVKDAFLGRADGGAAASRSSLRRIRTSIRATLFFNDAEDGPGKGLVPSADHQHYYHRQPHHHLQAEQEAQDVGVICPDDHLPTTRTNP